MEKVIAEKSSRDVTPLSKQRSVNNTAGVKQMKNSRGFNF